MRLLYYSNLATQADPSRPLSMAIRRMHSLFCGFLLLMGQALPLVAHAQDATVLSADATAPFERVAGLSHHTVLALLQDREGFIWIGTADGLSRYDGYAFITYRHDPADSTSLSHNTVTALLETEDGMLWVGTEDGLNVLDRSTGRFARHYIFPDRLPGGIVALSESPGGVVWASILSGLSRYDPRTEQADFFSPAEPDIEFYTMSQEAAGLFWLGTGAEQNRLYQFDPATGQFQGFLLPPSWNTSSAIRSLVDRNHVVWVGGARGLATLDTTAGTFEQLSLEVVRGEIWLEDRRGGLWIEGSGTQIGKLWRYDPQTHEATSYVLDETGTNRLTHDVRAVIEDRAGALWVGTLGGLFRLDAQTKSFSHLHQQPEAPHSLSSNTVMAVCEGHDGVLWVGTLGGGLNRVDQTTGTITTYRHRAHDPASLCHDDVWAVYEDDAGILWLGTEAGLCHFDPNRKHFTQVGDSSYVYVLTADADGKVWVGGRLLQRLDPQSGALERYEIVIPHQSDNELLGNLQSIYPTRAGVIWLGTEFGGLWRFEPGTKTITGYPVATDAPYGLRGKAVRFIHPDSDDQALWLGTDFGLVRFDIQQETFRPYLLRDGLPGSSVFGILPDDDGRLWISTNQGLARFDPATEHFTLYTETDGTGNTEYNRRAAFRGADGMLYFGGLNGVTSFHPNRIRANPIVPPVALTRIEVARRDTVRVLGAHGLDELLLSYLDYTFAFEYAALNYTNPAKNRYAYQLEGFDEEWVDAGTRRRAAYTNIPPGRYTFRVKGANEDGVWNEQGTALRVYIAPPWWATWWFRLLAVALVLSVFYMAYRYRVAHLLHEERLRLRIASDLHDEIGSKLSSIALASEMVTARATLGDREQRQLGEVTRQARRMVDDLRDIVWFVNPRHDQLDDLVVRMRHIAANVLEGLRYTFDAPVDGLGTALDMERRRHVYLMYREVLTNIVRHAHAKQVDIHLARRNGTLELTIRDDGLGFDPTAPSQGEGLHNLHMRAAAVGGAVRIESQPGTGTTIHITAKIPGG